MFKRNRRHSRGHKGNTHCCPPQMMPTQCCPPQFSPQEQFVHTNVMHTVVPHVHPAHVTTVNKHVIDHQHYFPVTHSTVNEYQENHTRFGTPYSCNRGQRSRY